MKLLVTGGSGFIAGHCVLTALAAGHEVRASVRSLDREAAVRAELASQEGYAADRLSFAAADLTSDDGWAEALDGVDVVLHVASPVRPGAVTDEQEVIRPAVDGTLRVLRAATAAGVRRVVLTSAFHAVSWGYPRSDRVFTEADWTVLDGPGVDAYGRSMTLAERAAWDYVRDTSGAPGLVTLLPVAVVGPLLGQQVSGANHIVQRLLAGAVPASPHLYFPIVDVRDVAAAHVLAAENPAAAGQRFLLSNGPALAMQQLATLLRNGLGDAARKVPTRTMPNLVVRIGARFSPELRSIVPDLDYAKRTSNAKARDVLGWTPRPPQQAIIAAGRSLVDRALVD